MAIEPESGSRCPACGRGRLEWRTDGNGVALEQCAACGHGVLLKRVPAPVLVRNRPQQHRRRRG